MPPIFWSFNYKIKAYHNRRTKGLPLETICDIFSFLPVENILACNLNCLRLFRASQIIYRPLQRPCQRILKKLCITFSIDHNGNPFASAKFQFRLLENDDVYVRKYTFKCRRIINQSTERYDAFVTDNCLLGIQRSDTGKCWPIGPHLVQSLPAVGLPSDIVTIERIDLDLACKEQRRCRYNYMPTSEAVVYCSEELVCMSKMSCHHSF